MDAASFVFAAVVDGTATDATAAPSTTAVVHAIATLEWRRRFPSYTPWRPSIPNVDAAAWPPGFAYDFDVVLPLPPPPPGRSSYADTVANRPQRTDLPPRSALGASFASSSTPGEAAPRL